MSKKIAAKSVTFLNRQRKILRFKVKISKWYFYLQNVNFSYNNLPITIRKHTKITFFLHKKFSIIISRYYISMKSM